MFVQLRESTKRRKIISLYNSYIFCHAARIYFIPPKWLTVFSLAYLLLLEKLKYEFTKKIHTFPHLPTTFIKFKTKISSMDVSIHPSYVPLLVLSSYARATFPFIFLFYFVLFLNKFWFKCSFWLLWGIYLY